MPIQRGTRLELNKLRELFWFLIHGKSCPWCGVPFITPEEFAKASHGRAQGKAVDFADTLTIHHVDENRENHAPDNLVLMHRRCHKDLHNKARTQVRSAAADPGQAPGMNPA